jgi:ABC-type transport system substrate-binding protein
MLDRKDEGVTNPVGTGPFRFQSWIQSRSLSAVRFDRYWRKSPRGRSLPYLDAVEFRVMDDSVTVAGALRAGNVDLAVSLGSDLAERMANEFDVVQDYKTQRTSLILNTTQTADKANPFTNVHARRALAYATDRSRIAKKIGRDVETTTNGYRSDSPWAPTGGDEYVAYDPALARKEIEIYKKETGAKTLEFLLNAQPSIDVQMLVQDLKDNLAEVGIKVVVNIVDAPKIPVLTALGDYHASMSRLHDFPDPDQMNFFYSAASIHPSGQLSLNFTRYTSPRLESNLKVLHESTDFARRKAANDDLIRETNGAAIEIWLYDTPSALVTNRRLSGLDGYRSHTIASVAPKPWLAEVFRR